MDIKTIKILSIALSAIGMAVNFAVDRINDKKLDGVIEDKIAKALANKQ